MKTKKSVFWFWSWIVLVTRKLDRKDNDKSKCLIWKNLILVSGRNATDAYAKAVRIGRKNASSAGEDVKLDGKPAETRFLGISDMGVIHDALEDGCELYFRETRASWDIARGTVQTERKLLRSLKQELGPYMRIKWNPHERVVK